jgi:hypothetical protein
LAEEEASSEKEGDLEAARVGGPRRKVQDAGRRESELRLAEPLKRNAFERR